MPYNDERYKTTEDAKGIFGLRGTNGIPMESPLKTPGRTYTSISHNSLFGSSKNPSPSFSTSRPEDRKPASSPGPSTPSRTRIPEQFTTPASRRAIIARCFSDLSVYSPVPPSQQPFTSFRENHAGAGLVNDIEQYLLEEEVESSHLPRTLFPSPPAKVSVTNVVTPRTRRLVRTNSDSDVLTDVDTESVTSGSTRGSFSSLGRSIPSTSSFSSGNPNIRERIEYPQTGSGDSPSNYRKPIEPAMVPALNGYLSIEIANAASSSLSLFTKAIGSGVVTKESPIDKFLSGPLGWDLKPHVIAHDTEVQSLLDRAEIAWGVQYEIARGISQGLWSWSDVKLKITQFKGTNEEVAPRVRSFLLNRPVKIFDTTIWQELDREQLAIMENRGRGLGLMGTWEKEPNWHGGKIQQLARLVPDKGTYQVCLEPMEKRRSYRLARYLGSRRILQLHVPERDNLNVRAFLLHKFILCGRIFVPIFSKENSAYLVEVSDNYQRTPAGWCGDRYRKSFKDIIEWHNGLQLNADQPIAKWSTRFALAFSSSKPILEFKEERIDFIEDNCSPSSGKPSAGQTHTDGCGFINEAALKVITQSLNCDGRPTAVQGRIMGSKGLWILHPYNKEPEPRIWIRASQRKIVYQSRVHRAHLILDLVAISRSSAPVSLSPQSIMNLSVNGIPDSTLVELMLNGVIEQVKPLMIWEGPQAMEMLWSAINHLGAVRRSRFKRLTAGLGRILGLEPRTWKEEDLVGESGSDFTGRNEYSGAPLQLHESTVELIQADFHPKYLDLLRDKIRFIVSLTIESIVEKFSIPLPESLGGFIVPDPLNILKEGEVYYRSSQPLTDPVTQSQFNVVTGDVLIGRYPVRLPSDIQKAKMVDHPALFGYPDVLIVSTRGATSFASLLSGGDYDGDEVFIIREQSLVEPFQSKPLAQMPTNLVKDNFERDPERVEQFALRAATMNPPDAQVAFQKILLLSLEDVKHGLYSTYHDFSSWAYGYADERSIRLAYMFNTLLDSGKTGLHLKPDVFEGDQRCFSGQVPESSLGGSNAKRYIFHTLRAAGKKVRDEFLVHYDSLAGTPDTRKEVKDPTLLQPYNKAIKACEAADVVRNELNRIKEVVDRALVLHKDAMRALASNPKPVSPVKKRGKKREKTRQREPTATMEACQQYDTDIGGIYIFQNIAEIKASYAYSLNSRFAFDVAFRDLCTIKAKASVGGVVASTRSFDEAKTIPSTYVRALTRLPMEL